jgi:peptide/nickel transport system substrate-binding protein
MRKLLPKMILFTLVFSLTIGGRGIVEAAEPTKGPQYGGILRIVDDFRITFLGYPQKMSAGWVMRAAGPAIETLLRIDEEGRTIPWLATDFRTDPKAATITLTLRKGVKFHDGTDFNAEAAKWNLDQAISTKQFGSVLINSVDVVDPYSVRINLKQWDNTVLGMLGYSYMAMMISPMAFKKNGEEWCANNPVGTGPFRFVSWEKDLKITYKKFDGYWQKGKPYLDGIEILFIADKVVAGLGFRRGETHLLLSPLFEDLGSFKKEGYTVTGTVRCFSSPLGAAIPDASNPKSPFADLRVRQAAQHAIDGKAIVDAVLYGHGEAATQWIYKGHPAYNADIVGYPYNPAKAKQLLAEAGYPNGFKTKYTYFTGGNFQEFAVALAGQLRNVGIEVELVLLTIARVLPIMFGGGTWEGLIYAGPPPWPDFAAGLRDRFAGDGRNFSLMIAPDDYKEAIRNAVAAPDLETKNKWTQRALKLMTDKYCLSIYCYFQDSSVVHHKYVHHPGFYEVPSLSLWTPEDAWMEKK